MQNISKIVLQSGVIPFIRENNEIKIVLVTSKSTNQWIIPKGTIENELLPEISAAKEALEEAGVKGDVYNSVFSEYTYEKNEKVYYVKIYLMEVSLILDEWEEMKVRHRKVASLSEAIQIIKIEQLEVLKAFEKQVRDGKI